MASRAQRLPVLDRPEERAIAAMRLDVIDEGSRRDAVAMHAEGIRTDRVLAEVSERGPAPG